MNFSFLTDKPGPGQSFVVPVFPYHPKETFLRITDWEEVQEAYVAHDSLESAGQLADALSVKFNAMPAAYFRALVSAIVKHTTKLPDGTRVLLQKQDGIFSLRVPAQQKIIPIFDSNNQQEIQ